MSIEQSNETKAVSENPPQNPQSPQPRKWYKVTKRLLIFLIIEAAIGGGCLYYLYDCSHGKKYSSSTKMLARVQCELNVGNTREAEAILKDCIRRTDSACAKAKLVELCWKTEDFRQMLLLDKTMARTNRNEPCRLYSERAIEQAFAEGYEALASKEFSEKKWNDASSHFFTAYYRFPFYTTIPSSGLTCLRNAIAASFNAGDKAKVKSYGDKFLEHCRKHPKLIEDETTKKYMQDVQNWLREIETR